MIHSERYKTAGFLLTVWRDLGGVVNHARFYETQYALLGAYNVLFGHDIALWYIATFSQCLATGLLICAIVGFTTGEVPAAVSAATVFLTASPLAEATRANFGKVEVPMAFFFVLSLALWFLAETCTVRLTGRGRRTGTAVVLAASLLSLIVAAVAKESGRLLGCALILAACLNSLFAHLDRRARRWNALLAVFGVTATGACVLAFFPSHNNEYIKRYFTLDPSPAHMWRSAVFYLEQSGDVFAVALVTLALLPLSVRLGSRRVGWNVWHLNAATFAVACLYVGLLLTTHFQIPYYLYVPNALLALSFGWSVGALGASNRGWLALFLLLTRLYSVPYNYYVAGAQRYFDEVNDLAMRTVLALAPQRVISLDIGDRSQLIQEWNLLRWFSFGGTLAPIYGAKLSFVDWSYQREVRNLNPRSFDPALFHGKRNNLERTDDNLALEIELGDLVAVRSGTLRAFHVALRGVMPQSFDPAEDLRVLDPGALGPPMEVGGPVPGMSPVTLGGARFDYRWEFFRVVSLPRYVLIGRETDGWMLKEATLRLLARRGALLKLTFEVPGWLPFRYPWRLVARLDGQDVARVDATSPGIYTIVIPCDSGGLVMLESEQWFQPSSLGVSPDLRQLSYRVVQVKYEDPAEGRDHRP